MSQTGNRVPAISNYGNKEGSILMDFVTAFVELGFS